MLSLSNSSKLTKSFLTFLEIIFAIFFIYLICVAFGASLTENLGETLLFSSYMALICIVPNVIIVEHDDLFSLIHRLFIREEFETNAEVVCTQIAKNAIKGAWFGALVIPLDWDRWWQTFPVPCCIGASVGAFYGIIFSKMCKFKL